MSKVSEYISLPGEFPAYPKLMIKPTAQRSTSLPNVGWKRRWIIAVTNNGTEAIANYDYALDIGLTNGLVSGSRALANGNDLRVWNNGQEVARTLVDWNSATHATLIWVKITFLNPGETDFFDVVHFNLQAGTPPTLTPGIDAPVFDTTLTGASRSTNTKWIYPQEEDAANAGEGIWWLTTGIAQPNFSVIAPGAWAPIMSVPNEDSRAQPMYTAFEDGGTKYIAKFDTKRARYSSTAIGSDQGSDGVFIHSPIGISSIRANFLFDNPAIKVGSDQPIGKLVVAGRRTQGEKWITAYENATLGAGQTIAVNTYTFPSGTKDALLALWPLNNVVVDSTARSDVYAQAKTNTILEVNLPGGVITQEIYQAETEIYELAEELRYRGGYTKVPPYASIQVGNVEQASGVGTPRAAIELNKKLVINTPLRTMQIWNSALDTFYENLSENSYRTQDAQLFIDGSIQMLPSNSWMEIRPTSVEITNPDALINNSNWSLLAADPYVATGSIIRSASNGSDGLAGRFELDISAWLSTINLVADSIAQADNTAVASWTDLSGNANHADNATGTEQPTLQTNEINGHSIVRFDGVDDDLTIFGHGLTKPFTLFHVTKLGSGNINSDRIVHSTGFWVGVSTGLNHTMNGNSALIYKNGTDLLPHIHSNLFSATAGTSEGSYDGTVVVGDANNNAASGNAILGSTGSASWIAMDLAEFHAFSGAMPLLTRQKLDRILADKYGLVANLPSNHPYKNSSVIGGDGLLARAVADEYIPTGGDAQVWFSADLMTNDLALVPTLAILFYDYNQTFIREDVLTTWTPAAISTWYRVAHAARVPSNAEYWRVGIYGSGTALVTAKTIYWDRVRLKGPDIILYDPSRGTLELSYEVEPRYSGA